jgi:S-DNA-T family DNA segregation ATPase FtsK/SpoIIIE
MAAKTNRQKSPESGKEPEPAETLASEKPGFKAMLAAIFSERLISVLSLFFMLFSIFLIFAFFSHLFNWQNDYDKVSSQSWIDLITDTKSEVGNSLGEIGALFSYVFMHQWFGVAAFLIPFCLFIVAFKGFFHTALLPIRKTLMYSLFAIIFVSVATALVFKSDLIYGGFGYQLNQYLTSIMGAVGVVLLLVFSAMTFLMLNFQFRFELPQRSAKPKLPDTEEADDLPQSRNNRMKMPWNTAEEEEEEGDSEEEELPWNEPVEDESPEIAAIEPEAETQGFELNLSDSAHLSAPLSGAGMAPSLEIHLPEPEPEIEAPAAETPSPSVLVQEGMSEEDKERMNLTEVLADPQEFDLGEYDPTLDLSSYRYPEAELLENHGSNKAKVDKAELEANSNRIIETLKSYGIEIARISASIGPTVTLYEIVPAAGVRISKIKNLEDDIALSLSALGIRIIAPMPGKGTIGIEVPNQNPEVVAMKTLITSEKFANTTMDLPVALGKTISNENFVADLAKMPHLLMAGATGQGKSVGLNAILVSLLYKKHPSQIKFVLVDPKKVELTLFNKIERHFLAKLPNNEEAIITDVKKVVYTLNSLCVLMDQRYELLKMAMVRNIKEYNAKFLSRKLNPKLGHHYMPYIVLVVDEFADLIMTAGKEVELPIARLAQLARAIGIHLIIATQRPSVNIITGTIKANFPARIAFRVTSKIDSRTILDAGGAEQLIGRGDLLFSTGSDLIRLQCPFVDTPEVEKICEFIGGQRGYPSAFILPEYIDENAEMEDDFDIGDRDSMFDEAAHIVVTHQQGSASLLQRKLKLGYNRAGRIIDQLEKAGIIGPFEGSKARKVLIKDSMTLEQFLKNSDSDL